MHSSNSSHGTIQKNWDGLWNIENINRYGRRDVKRRMSAINSLNVVVKRVVMEDANAKRRDSHEHGFANVEEIVWNFNLEYMVLLI